MHYITSKLVIIALSSPIILVSGCSGFGSFNSINPIPDEKPSQQALLGDLTVEPRSIDALIAEQPSASPEEYSETNNAFTQEPVVKPENWISHSIQKGQTLSKILVPYGISQTDINTLVKSSEIAHTLQNIQTGRKLRLLISDSKQLLELEYKRNRTETIKISKTDSGFISNIVSADVTRTQTYVHGAIHNSFFTDAKIAGLSDTIIMQLSDIFAWDIDFALNIHTGDRFSVLYEQLSIDGESIGNGDILAAEFKNNGKVYRAVRYKDSNGHVNYYSPEGEGLRQAFLRTPVKFTRISSRFSLGRKHPVLNRIRAHKGVDYAAATGTPIRATGMGKIIYRGRKGGYGKVIILKHGSRYTTLYAHLSNFRRGKRVGSTVKQGDIIGYVGSTGLASGPHLHYEFRIAGVHKNPLTTKLPKSRPIADDEQVVFKAQTTPLLAELDKQTDLMLASSDRK
ncbi:MAG: peptidoglycan DD-metalloendopeptidase family protein [Methylococcales bacterium]